MSQTMNNIRRAEGGNTSVATKPKDFPAMLEQYKGEIARALPKHMNPDRMMRIALTSFRMTPKLADCDPRSVFAAVIQSSQLGLEVGLMGEAHLVPFGNQCQLIPGYTGLMKLARNSGLVTDIYAEAVRIKDTFSLKLGMDRSLVHEPLTAPGGFPASDEERGEIVGFYAVGVLKDGSKTFIAMSRAEVLRIRDGSKGYQAAKKYKKESIWDTDFTSMGLKTAIRRLSKWLPKSPELATALALDDNAGRQQLNVNDAIDGVFTPIPDDETGEITPVTKVEGETGKGMSLQQQWDKYDEVLAAFGKVEAENYMPREPRPQASGSAASSAAPGEKKAATKLEKLDKVVASLREATSIEALDEVYVRAEGELADAELEIALREYRKCKDAITNGGNGLFD